MAAENDDSPRRSLGRDAPCRDRIINQQEIAARGAGVPLSVGGEDFCLATDIQAQRIVSGGEVPAEEAERHGLIIPHRRNQLCAVLRRVYHRYREAGVIKGGYRHTGTQLCVPDYKGIRREHEVVDAIWRGDGNHLVAAVPGNLGNISYNACHRRKIFIIHSKVLFPLLYGIKAANVPYANMIPLESLPESNKEQKACEEISYGIARTVSASISITGD